MDGLIVLLLVVLLMVWVHHSTHTDPMDRYVQSGGGLVENYDSRESGSFQPQSTEDWLDQLHLEYTDAAMTSSHPNDTGPDASAKVQQVRSLGGLDSGNLTAFKPMPDLQEAATPGSDRVPYPWNGKAWYTLPKSEVGRKEVWFKPEHVYKEDEKYWDWRYPEQPVSTAFAKDEDQYCRATNNLAYPCYQKTVKPNGSVPLDPTLITQDHQRVNSYVSYLRNEGMKP